MSSPFPQEFSGKSIDEAIAEGLRKLGLRSDQVTIEVVSKGSRGLFGLGSEPAVVRMAPKGAGESSAVQSAPEQSTPATPPAAAAPLYEPALPAASGETAERAADMVSEGAPAATAPAAPVAAARPADVESAAPTPVAARSEPPEQDDEIAALAADMLNNVVRLMGFDARVEAQWRDADDITEERHLLLSVHGRDVSALIGRRGETLENLQYLLRLMVNQRMHRWLNIIVDVEEYRSKRVDHLTHLAQRMADQVASTGRSFALEPMPPNERRIVHLALRDDTRIFTESTGEGERRKVNIFPRK
jgi:spoIIIJ-associated protein